MTARSTKDGAEDPAAGGTKPPAAAAVILAAGEGSRMRSSLPKVVHEVAGRPMVQHVVRAARAGGCARIVVVIGHGADAVRNALAAEDGVEFVVQERQLGTGHALGTAADALRDFGGAVFALNGDGPMIRGGSLHAMRRRQGDGPGMTLMTVRVPDPYGLGRVVRGADGAVRAIVEEKDAGDEERAIDEIVPGVYLFDPSVWERIGRLSTANAQGEIYITDLPATYLADGEPVRAFEVADASEALAANDRVQLAGLDRAFRDRIRATLMHGGVTLVAPDTIFVDDDVEVGEDVVLEPFVVLTAGTRVGVRARIGAASHLTRCSVAPGALVPPHTVAADRTLH